MPTKENHPPTLAAGAAASQDDTIRRISSCELCGNPRLSPVLNLGTHPLCDDLIPIGDTRTCRSYPIEILYCDRCRTAHQKHQVPKTQLFPASYHYRSRFTRDVLSGMRHLVAQCEGRYGSLAGRKVLDVGCNDGSLLDRFAERSAVCSGIEPTGAAMDSRAKGHMVYNEFLTPALADMIVEQRGTPDFLVFTNVFAHIEDMSSLLASVRRLMGPTTVLVIENHYLGSIIASRQFDTFYHEHPRTYSATSFLHVARALGRCVDHVEFPDRYGGNIRVFIQAAWNDPSRPADGDPADDFDEAHFGDGLGQLGRQVDDWRVRKSTELRALVESHGPLRAKAFPGRAAILLGLLGVDRETICAVYEKPGSMKIGHYVPGTRIPILSDDKLFRAGDHAGPIMNLAWHIGPEIRDYLAEKGYGGGVIDILD